LTEYTTFVLIPGAGADPRVYEATIEALHDLGQDGIAPPLPLDGADAGPSAHADAIVAALPDPRPAPLVVVGHSLGAYTGAIAELTARLGPPDDWDEAALDEVFYHDVDAATMAANDEYAGRPAPGMFAEPLPVSRWPYVPTTVLAPTEDRLFPLEFQRRLTRERLGEGVAFEAIPGGHLPFLSRPRELAARLVEPA
jgi:pimeloyl-ACP methyl ester carboxylesterase